MHLKGNRITNGVYSAVLDKSCSDPDMLADPERGHRLPARAAATHLNRPDRERGSVLSTVVRHTAWLDGPRLCAALARSDFSLRDLNRARFVGGWFH